MKTLKTTLALLFAATLLLAACGAPASESDAADAPTDRTEANAETGDESAPEAESLPPAGEVTSESLPPQDAVGDGDDGYGDDDPVAGGNPPATGGGESTGVIEVPGPHLPPVRAAVADLADRLGVDDSAVEIAYVEAVTWPDAGRGCPEPGMSYTQVTQDGLRIVLSVDGVPYTYHSGGDGAPFLCEDDLSAREDTPPIEGTIIVGEKPVPPGEDHGDTDVDTDDHDE